MYGAVDKLQTYIEHPELDRSSFMRLLRTRAWGPGSTEILSGAMNPNAKFFIVMGKTDPSADRHRQQSMILVERDTPGVDVMGYDDHEHGGRQSSRSPTHACPRAT